MEKVELPILKFCLFVCWAAVVKMKVITFLLIIFK